MRNIFIVGTGGLAKETAGILNILYSNRQIGKFCGYIASKTEEKGRKLPYGEVIGTDLDIFNLNEDIDIIIAIGNPAIKAKAVRNYKKISNISYPNIIDPRSNIDHHGFQIGKGNIITCGSYISCNVSIADHCLINWNATIGHDSKINSYAVINPGARLSGFSNIGKTVLIGAGAIILENISIPDNTTIGAGAVVTKNIEEAATFVGVPARKLKKT